MYFHFLFQKKFEGKNMLYCVMPHRYYTKYSDYMGSLSENMLLFKNPSLQFIFSIAYKTMPVEPSWRKLREKISIGQGARC